MTSVCVTRVPRGHYRFWHVARMEWIKLRTLRSTWWTMGIGVAGAVAIGVAVGRGTKNASGDLTNNALAGMVPGLLLAGMPAPALGQPGVLRAVLLSGTSFCLIGLLGLGLGAIIRHSPAAIGVLVGGVYVLAQVIGAIAHGVRAYMPILIVGNSISTTKPVSCGGPAGQCPQPLPAWTGLGMLCLYAAAALAAGGWVLSRRDA